MLNFVVLIQRLCDIYGWLIVIWCILSWVPRTGSGLFEDVRAAIATLVEPYLNLFRRFVPPLMGIDFSPVIAILVLSLVERVLLTAIL
ncbi:YggT family protein [Thermophilibacter mediterraneus]|uniref:YggT family protein n=1 Tax=Thermophilibacter mediterraneus TaxID=1871031 RepID=UPI000930B8D5|nr:YggT family protein [Thermophilibacter mediterraneus]